MILTFPTIPFHVFVVLFSCPKLFSTCNLRRKPNFLLRMPIISWLEPPVTFPS